MGIPISVIPQGFSQATAAMQHVVAMSGGRRARVGGRRRRKASAKRSRASTRGPATRRAKRRSGKRAHLVKGSRAAKLYMAKIRRKRR